MTNSAHPVATEKWWRHKTITPLVLIAVAAVIALALLVTPPDIPSAAKAPVPVSVRMVTVDVGPRRLTVTSEGTVKPRAETNLIAQVSGEVIWVSDNLLPGGQFAKGDLLVRLDQQDYLVALKNAEAELSRATAEKNYAKAEVDRINALFEQNLASVSQRQLAERAFDVTRAVSLSAEANLERARLDLKRTEVRAPFTGRVRNEAIDIGQFLQKGAAITSIYATGTMEIKLPVPDSQLAFLHDDLAQTGIVGESHLIPVTLEARFAGREQQWEGRLARTEGSIDERSRFIYLIAEVTKPVNEAGTRLPVGLFVKADIEGRLAENVVTLPRSALRDTDTVLIIDDENTLHFRNVTVLRLADNEVLISDGLAAGERVSISPLQFVVEGMPVTVVD